MRLKRILQNFSFTIASNFFALLISTIAILIVPKLIGVYEYGLWQLFIFYSSYVGILHFGWLDGIYLRYGGNQYNDLDKKMFKSQFIFLLLSQLLFSVIISVGAFVFLNGNIKSVCYSVALVVVIVNVKTYFQFLLQMTNRIMEYAISNFISTIVYALVLVVFICLHIQDYRFYIFSYVIGQFFALIYCVVICNDIVTFESKISLNFSLHEIRTNISVGVKLVLSNIAGMLIVGIVRFGIQHGWNIETFGKISLVLSISNLLMVFVGSVSLVLFPILKRVDPSKMKIVYDSVRDILMPIVFIGMLVYFPIKLFIPLWLPKYESAMLYMSILFPMVAYQAKFEVLSNTFLKVLRMERPLMMINIGTLILSATLTMISVGVIHSLTLTVLVIIIVMSARSIFSEWYINYSLKISFRFEIFLETFVVGVFIISTWMIPIINSLVVYLVTLVGYLFIKRVSIKKAVNVVMNI